MSSHSALVNLSFQGADLGRAASEGTLCGPGAIELPGCLSGEECDDWDEATGSVRTRRSRAQRAGSASTRASAAGAAAMPASTP